MAGNGSDAKDARLIAGLLTGKSTAGAAHAAGYSERTAYRRLHDPEFRALLVNSAAAIRAAVEAQLVAIAGEAVEALRVVMTTSASATARVAAARAVLQVSGSTRFGDFNAAEFGLDDWRRTPLAVFLASNPSAVGPVVTALAAIRDAHRGHVDEPGDS